MSSTSNFRPPAVAGMFYSSSAQELTDELHDLLAHAKTSHTQDIQPKALIVPHAGYAYSGAIAASAYQILNKPAIRSTIRRVILLGPTHRAAVSGLALPAADINAFATPLGRIPIDTALAQLALQLPQVRCSNAAHAQEHSLEVQLPFLQTLLDNFTLLPLAVGSVSASNVAEVLDLLWGEKETLIIISSDLSHYRPYVAAQRMDQTTVEQILSFEPLANHEQACGAIPINGFLLSARKHGLQGQLLDLRNSGDTGGDRSRVVGYASFAFTEN